MPCSIEEKTGIPCQFHVPEQRLIERGAYGQKWCIYHLPLGGTLGDKYDKASWKQEKIDEFNELIYLLCKKHAQGNLNLNDVVFPGDIRLKGMDLSDVSFDRCVILGNIDFSGSKFLHASFVNIEIRKTADLMGIECFGPVDFERAQINHIVFNDAIFHGSAYFKNCIFTAPPSFSNAKFFSNVKFEGAKFNAGGVFKSCEFNDHFSFHDTMQRQILNFSSSKFNGPANFSLSPAKKGDPSWFFEVMLFENVIFEDVAVFTHRTFSNITSFSDSLFRIAPRFYDCTLHQDTNFRRAKFHDTSAEVMRAYRTLKLQMENVRDRNEEGRFYALEQQCIRNDTETELLTRIFSRAYQLFSYYGLSVGRPLLSMLGSLLLFGLLFAGISSPIISPTAPPDWSLLGKSFMFSLEQLVNPFWVWKTQNYPVWMSGHIVLFKIMATFESILFLSFFALFLFAIRWRFKRG